MATQKQIILRFIVLGVSIPLISIYFFYTFFYTKKSPFDVVDKENPKIVAMFNKQIAVAIKDNTQSDFYPGLIKESKQNFINFLNTISQIQSHTQYGVASSKSRNKLEVDITFKDGTTAKNLYTSNTCYSAYGPCLLLKILMKNGEAVQVFTNGAEKNGSPDWIVNDLNTLLEAANSYDRGRNRTNYFPPDKNKTDFEKEWEEKK